MVHPYERGISQFYPKYTKGGMPRVRRPICHNIFKMSGVRENWCLISLGRCERALTAVLSLARFPLVPVVWGLLLHARLPTTP